MDRPFNDIRIVITLGYSEKRLRFFQETDRFSRKIEVDNLHKDEYDASLMIVQAFPYSFPRVLDDGVMRYVD